MWSHLWFGVGELLAAEPRNSTWYSDTQAMVDALVVPGTTS